jgi:hypothetical protein
MNFVLKRIRMGPDGIFGELRTEKGDLFCQTLEHAFCVNGLYKAAIPPGTYECVRYHSTKHGYDVFMLKDVPGHDFIEIHIGCINEDSEGCILLGLEAREKMILESHRAFDNFMALQAGVNSFQLIVR